MEPSSRSFRVTAFQRRRAFIGRLMGASVETIALVSLNHTRAASGWIPPPVALPQALRAGQPHRSERAARPSTSSSHSETLAGRGKVCPLAMVDQPGLNFAERVDRGVGPAASHSLGPAQQECTV